MNRSRKAKELKSMKSIITSLTTTEVKEIDAISIEDEVIKAIFNLYFYLERLFWSI